VTRLPIARRSHRGVLVDSNLLLLLFVGKIGREHIAGFKRTRRYRVDDFDLLAEFVDRLPPLVTTPNILTEVSNLAGRFYGDKLAEFRAVFAHAVAASLEKYRASRLLVVSPHFRAAGLADAAMIEIAHGGGYLLLTDDQKLSALASAKGVEVANLKEIRAAARYYKSGDI
jgi:rRNA-processing protein FCF1